MKSGVYIITNQSSGKIYVGSSRRLASRFAGHLSDLRLGIHHNRHLLAAWKKYGETAFLFRCLLYCDAEDLLFFEQRAIDTYSAHLGWPNLYNQHPNAASPRGCIRSAEVRAAISARQKGKKLSEEHKAKVGAAGRGRKHSAETRAKMSARLMGNKLNAGYVPPPEVRAKISAAHKGRRFTSEHCAKLSAVAKGRFYSAETRAKMAKAQLGRTHSEETKAKIATANSGTHPAERRATCLRAQRARRLRERIAREAGLLVAHI